MSSQSFQSRAVIFIGAADEICGEAVRLFANATDMPMLLAGSNGDKLRQVAAKLSSKHMSTKKIDLFNPDELRGAIANAALVIQGAQPYYRTSLPVTTACIEAKVPFMDYPDHVESTQKSLDLSDRAEREGVPCCSNCGPSPEMTNLLALDIAEELDTVETIDICWLVGEEGGQLGREVLEHLMHITAGPCLTWANGKAEVHENWVETCYAPMFSDGDVLFLTRVFTQNPSRCHVDFQTLVASALSALSTLRHSTAFHDVLEPLFTQAP